MKKIQSRIKTLIDLTRLHPNGIVGEKMVLSLRLSDWLREQTDNEKKISHEQLDEIEIVLYNALNKIEDLLKINNNI